MEKTRIGSLPVGRRKLKSSDKSMTDIAKDLGLHRRTLARWNAAAKVLIDNGFPELAQKVLSGEMKEKEAYAQASINQISGYVYVLTNYLLPNVVKIGMTDGNLPQVRVNTINKGAGVYGEWKLEFMIQTDSPRYAESVIHRELHVFRIQKDKEFFRMSLEEAKAYVFNLSKEEL